MRECTAAPDSPAGRLGQGRLICAPDYGSPQADEDEWLDAEAAARYINLPVRSIYRS